MKLKQIGLIAFTLLNASLFAMPANAENLNISNQTSYNLSFYVNGVCSRHFGSVNPYGIKTVSDYDFKRACKHNIAPCEVVVINSKYCQGLPIATVKYYVKQNYVELYGHPGHNLTTSVSGYNLFFSEPIKK